MVARKHANDLSKNEQFKCISSSYDPSAHALGITVFVSRLRRRFIVVLLFDCVTKVDFKFCALQMYYFDHSW